MIEEKKMKKILIISDTHGYCGDDILKYAQQVDEIWHAGDIGTIDVLRKLSSIVPCKFVYGNIDNQEIRIQTKEYLIFECEGCKVLITHIAGYPNHYYTGITQKIKAESPTILVAGHSHILKVIPDTKYNLLFINPGAIGKSGFHSVRTMILMEIENGKPQNMQVIEYTR